MSAKVFGLRQAVEELRLCGEWTVEYTDRTHLNKDVYLPVGTIRIEGDEKATAGYRLLPFWVRPISPECLRKHIQKQVSGKGADQVIDRAIRFILQGIAESVMRVGILPPVIEAEDLARLEQELHFIAVTDTGALKRGVMTYLYLHFAGRKSIWTTIPTVSMMEIQDRAEHLDSVDRRAMRRAEMGQAEFKNVDVVRIRPLVTCSMWEVAALRASCPVDFLSVDPSLVRQFPSLSPEAVEAGPEKNFIQDRLIIESVKTLKRERAIDKGLYILTGDKSMASFAEAENISSIYVGVPDLPAGVYSVRYNLYRQAFVACPLAKFLWDLAAVFSKIRLTQVDSGAKVELSYYHAQRQKLLDDRLEVTVDGSDFVATPA